VDVLPNDRERLETGDPEDSHTHHRVHPQNSS
jgi:hypothetical protein